MHVRTSEAAVAISKWHFGKLIILWAWCAALAGLFLTDFLRSPVEPSPYRHLFEFLILLLILLTLSAVTWRWLGSKGG
jgi:hypothetical protein